MSISVVQRPMTVSDTVFVPAGPSEVYALIADPTQTPRWSPENTGAIASHAGPLVVGDRFVGTRVTETWVDDRAWPDAVCAVADRVFTGGSMFSDFQRRNIRTSLDRLGVQVGPGPALTRPP